MMTDPPWDSVPLLNGQEAERQMLRARREARAETLKHWAAGVGIALFIGTVVFIACAS